MGKEYVCPVCKKHFFKKVYKKCQAVYCSQSCAYKGRTLGFTKRIVTKPYKCKRKKPRICLICQKEYIYRKITQKYCSRSCFEIAHKANMKGKNNPAYIDGRSKLKRTWRGDAWETLRKEIYKRDDYICQACKVKCISKNDYNKEKNNWTLIIQCHHVEEYKINQNNNKENLITLCLECHLTIHHKE